MLLLLLPLLLPLLLLPVLLLLLVGWAPAHLVYKMWLKRFSWVEAMPLLSNKNISLFQNVFPGFGALPTFIKHMNTPFGALSLLQHQVCQRCSFLVTCWGLVPS